MRRVRREDVECTWLLRGTKLDRSKTRRSKSVAITFQRRVRRRAE